MRIFLQVLKNVLLCIVVLLAGTLWFMEKMVEGMAGHPRAVTGTNPIGADSIVRGVARGMVWVTSHLRGWLGHYVQNHHPRAFQQLQGIFQ